MNRKLFFVFLIGAAQLFAQRKVIIVDAQSQKPLAGVNITWGEKGEGMVSEEDGSFDKDVLKGIKEPIHFSYVGYKDRSILLKGVTSKVEMQPTSKALSEVVISKDALLSANQIMDSIQAHVKDNYNFNLTNRHFFLRQKDDGGVEQLDVHIKKSTIAVFDDAFAEKMIAEMPKENDFLTEVMGNHYGDLKKQKLLIEEGYKAYDTESTGYLENYYKKLEAIINEHVKSDSYFKIRTGILSFKTDANEAFLKDGEVVDVRNDMGNAKKQANFFLNDRKEMLGRVFEDIFLRKDTNIDFLKDLEKYQFEYIDDAVIDENDVFVLSFQPKSKKKYQGKLYVNQEDFSILKADFNSTKALFTFKLFGLSFKEKGNRGTIAFEKNSNGKYEIKYIKKVSNMEFGIDRPFVIVEKNKNVRGRRTQNKVKFDMLLKGSFQSHYDYVVLDSKPINEAIFQQVDESKSKQPKDWKRHNDNFWSNATEWPLVQKTIIEFNE